MSRRQEGSRRSRPKPPRRTIAERLAEYVQINPDSGCHEWRGACDARGYARIMFHGRNAKASRVAYEVHIGHIPPSLHVCHRCDNPKCVKPEHLFLGTASDNMQDMTMKGRRRGGKKAQGRVIGVTGQAAETAA